MTGEGRQAQTEAIGAVWFVYSEAGEPMGRLYRGEGALEPAVGARMPEGDEWHSAEITGVRELAPTCAMRRFRVSVRMDAGG